LFRSVPIFLVLLCSVSICVVGGVVVALRWHQFGDVVMERRHDGGEVEETTAGNHLPLCWSRCLPFLWLTRHLSAFDRSELI